MTKILITGASGFIGYHLSKKLSESGNFKILAADNFSNSTNDKYISYLKKNKKIKFINIDLNSQKSIERLPDVEIVIHLAAINGTQNFYESPFDVIYSSTIPTLNLLKRFSSKKLKQFIYAGSSESYAGLVDIAKIPIPTSENVPLGISNNSNPRWSYAISKIHGEIATVNSLKNIQNYTILRFHNIYGPRMGTKHVIPDFLERAKKKKYELFGAYDTRSFLYIDDAIDAVIKCINNKNCFNKTINIGSSKEIKIEKLGKLIMKILEINQKLIIHPSPKGSVKRRVPNTKLLRRLTNWREKTSLVDGLMSTINYYLSEVNQKK